MICMKRAIASCLALRMSLPFGTSMRRRMSQFKQHFKQKIIPLATYTLISDIVPRKGKV